MINNYTSKILLATITTNKLTKIKIIIQKMLKFIIYKFKNNKQVKN